MFTVCLVFVLCFAPYFAIRISLLHALTSLEKLELSAEKQLALRIVYLHTTFNPIIYCLYNAQVRKSLKQLFFESFRSHLDNHIENNVSQHVIYFLVMLIIFDLCNKSFNIYFDVNIVIQVLWWLISMSRCRSAHNTMTSKLSGIMPRRRTIKHRLECLR